VQSWYATNFSNILAIIGATDIGLKLELSSVDGGYYSVDWNTGLEYWTHIFFGFCTHSEVTFVMSLLTKCLHGSSTQVRNYNEDHSMIQVILLHEWNLIVDD